jgi:hypothetical protein
VSAASKRRQKGKQKGKKRVYGGTGPYRYTPKAILYRSLPLSRRQWVYYSQTMRMLRLSRRLLGKSTKPEVVEILRPGEHLSITTAPSQKRRSRRG